MGLNSIEYEGIDAKSFLWLPVGKRTAHCEIIVEGHQKVLSTVYVYSVKAAKYGCGSTTLKVLYATPSCL